MDCVSPGLVPRLEFESSTYTVSEPRTHEEVVMASVVVVRHGDKRETVEVRCGTRDGSAVSGIDYDARSDFLTFLPGKIILFCGIFLNFLLIAGFLSNHRNIHFTSFVFCSINLLPPVIFEVAVL